jgi:hypothetical protein
MVDEFVRVLEEFLGVQKVELGIAERWSQCPRESAGGKSLQEFLSKVI